MGNQIQGIVQIKEPDKRLEHFLGQISGRPLLESLNTKLVELNDGNALAVSTLTETNCMRQGVFEGVVMTSLVDLSASAAASSKTAENKVGYITGYSIKSICVPIGEKITCESKVIDFSENTIKTNSLIKVWRDGSPKDCATATTEFILKPVPSRANS